MFKTLTLLVLTELLAASTGTASSQAAAAERHPVLLFEEGDLATIRGRVARAPYVLWWQGIKTKADELLPLSTAQVESERERARAAKSLAFAFAVTGDSAYAARAADFLQAIRFPPRGGDLGEPHAGAEAALFAAEAYDLAAGYLQARPEAGGAIRALLAEEAARLYSDINLFGIPLWSTSQKNNWQVRVYSALGMLGMALADYSGGPSTPIAWVQRARTTVMDAIAYQVDSDGGYAEGPYYLLYGAQLYVPYMVAWKRFSGEDLLGDPVLRRLHDWSVKIRLPDGRRPNFDDAHLSFFLGNLLGGQSPSGGALLWDWESSAEHYVDDLYAAETICLYDDRLTAAAGPPWSPTLFLPEAGNAVFRSDWGRDAIYMLLMAEHGKARTSGLSHEHPDAASFVISAFGEVLALDGGYIDFDHHDRVNRAENHNLILVDGQGPQLQKFLGITLGASTDAFLGDTLSTDFVDIAQVTTSYQGVSVRRLAVFPDKRYFIVADEVQSTGAAHQYTWLLHGNGGQTSGGTFALEGRSARWRHGNAELLAYLAAPEGAELTEGQATHSFGYLQELTHSVLQAKASGITVRYLAALYPKRSGEPEPNVVPVFAAGGDGVLVERGVKTEACLFRGAGSTGRVSAAFNRGGAGTMWMDGRLGIVGFEAGSRRFLSVVDGTAAGIDGETVVEASVPMTIALRYGEGTIDGRVRSDQPGCEVTLAAAGRVTGVDFNGQSLPFRQTPGFVAFVAGGEGSFTVRAKPALDGDFNSDGAVDFHDFLLFAGAFGSGQKEFDLSGDGAVDFRDFIMFASAFGRRDE